MAKAKPAKAKPASKPRSPARAAAPETAVPAAAGLKVQARSMAGRLQKSALRRDAILAAALEEF
jgi:hypothetical protein